MPGGDEIISTINRLSESLDRVIVTQDWHPAGHHSFASSHDDYQAFEEIDVSYGRQVLWPDHCIQGTEGADFHPDLRLDRAQLILRKGFRPEIDSYSAFYENDRQTATGLTGYLRERGIRTLYIVGLAKDFCVHYSAVDASRQGFESFVVDDATRAIDDGDSLDRSMKNMRANGVRFISSEELLTDVIA